MKHKAKAIEAIEKASYLGRYVTYLINERGKWNPCCALGHLDFALRGERTENPYDTVIDFYGLTEEQTSDLTTINDRAERTDHRKVAVLEFLKNLPSED